MDNESVATAFACRVTDCNVLPLGALISSCRQSVAPTGILDRSPTPPQSVLPSLPNLILTSD